MGVYAIIGIPGSFKTAYAVQDWIIPTLKAGRNVFTNIDGLNSDIISALHDINPVDVSLRLELIDPADKESIHYFYKKIRPNTLVVIDETQNYFGSREWESKQSKDLIDYLTKARHDLVDVLYITQSLESVDITFRRLTALTYMIKRAEHLGLASKAKIFVMDRIDMQRAPLSTKWTSIKTDTFYCYSSYNEQVRGQKEKRVTTNPILRSPMLWFLIILSAYGVYTLFSGGPIASKFMQPKKLKTEISKGASLQEGVPPPAEAPNQDCFVSFRHINGQNIYTTREGKIYYEKIPPCPDGFSLNNKRK